MGITTWAWEQPVQATQKLVLLALADAADEHGVCIESIASLASRCSKSTRTVRRAIKSLIASDHLCRASRRRANGSTLPNGFTLKAVISPIETERGAFPAGTFCSRQVPASTARLH